MALPLTALCTVMVLLIALMERSCVEGFSLHRNSRSVSPYPDVSTVTGRTAVSKHYEDMLLSKRKSDLRNLINDCNTMCSFCRQQDDLNSILTEVSELELQLVMGVDTTPDSDATVNLCSYSCLLTHEPLAVMHFSYQFTERCYRCFQDVDTCGS